MSKLAPEHQQLLTNLSPEEGHLFLSWLEALGEKRITIQSWAPEMVPQLYTTLEKVCWSPWLEASQVSMKGRIDTFPEGQLVALEDTVPVASLSMNQIHWDGNPALLPSWDEVAGDPTDYSQTRDPKGNALVLMSMNVMPEKRGQHLPKQLITYVRSLAKSLRVQYIIGSFRPSEFGVEKQLRGCELSFEDYVSETVNRVDTDGSLGEPGMIVQLPKDGWLRSLSWLGMKPLKVDSAAMTVMVQMHQFDEYRRTYQPEKWWQKSPTEWECGEVGSWQISAEGATYREKNLWGMLTEQKGQK